MQKIILKIKGIRCKVAQNSQKEIHCRHYYRCGGCCGVKICECRCRLNQKNEQ